jgi:hypothetical protein
MSTTTPDILALRDFGYATGSYHCQCINCEGIFEGDKRAWSCLACATQLYMERSRKPQDEIDLEAAAFERGVRAGKMVAAMNIASHIERLANEQMQAHGWSRAKNHPGHPQSVIVLKLRNAAAWVRQTYLREPKETT